MMKLKGIKHLNFDTDEVIRYLYVVDMEALISELQNLGNLQSGTP